MYIEKEQNEWVKKVIIMYTEKRQELVNKAMITFHIGKKRESGKKR